MLRYDVTSSLYIVMLIAASRNDKNLKKKIIAKNNFTLCNFDMSHDLICNRRTVENDIGKRIVSFSYKLMVGRGFSTKGLCEII